MDSPDTDSLATAVVFRRWGKRNGGEVLALFPLEVTDYAGRYCSSYQHVGQHGDADYTGCIGATVPADVSEPDCAALKLELESAPYHYRLRVLKRAPHWRKIAAVRDAARQV
jgi:hypothetical protein